MPTSYRKLRVFLCHASQDKSVIRELNRKLANESWVAPWLDEEILLPGMDWDMEIEKAVEAADAVIVCLSNKSVSKEGYIQRELKFVLDIALEKTEGMIYVIPLRLDNCQVPRRLRAWQYVDYFPTEKATTAYKKLLDSLEARANLLDMDIEGIKNYFRQGGSEITEIPVPSEEAPKKNNSPITIIIVVIVLLFCCCFFAIGGWWLWNNADSLMKTGALLQQFI